MGHLPYESSIVRAKQIQSVVLNRNQSYSEALRSDGLLIRLCFIWTSLSMLRLSHCECQNHWECLSEKCFKETLQVGRRPENDPQTNVAPDVAAAKAGTMDVSSSLFTALQTAAT